MRFRGANSFLLYLQLHTYLIWFEQQLTSDHRIREKKDWYTTRRVVVRKRNGRIHLSRLGSRKQGSGSGYDSLDEASDEEESQSSSGFTLVNSNNESRSTGRSASSSFSSNFSR